jgi:glyoxylase-like metal-dependent hydrolase (beta-lactamase superfamily II)
MNPTPAPHRTSPQTDAAPAFAAPSLEALASPRAQALLAAASIAALLLHGCAATSHPIQKSTLGMPRTTQDLLAVIDQPGPVALETVNSADWAVPLGGLVNLDHPKAKAAGLADKDEPIQIYFHALRHPTKGLFIVDTGVEKNLRDDRDHAAVRGMVSGFMHFEKMKFNAPLGEWLAKAGAPLQGVFLTHLHLDHITGLADAPATAQVIGGPGEGGARAFSNLVVQGNTDRALEGKGPLGEWAFAPAAAKSVTPAAPLAFDGVLDVFGDGSVWALWVPGHTPGSTAYLVRTPTGPVLLTGDCSHTRWGWENGVEPGSFTGDQEQNAVSLALLRRLVAEHPAVEVRLGHQR